MVLDLIENYRNYAGLHPLWEKSVQFALSLKHASVGRYEQGEIFVLVQEGETRSLEESIYETHEKYWDIQIMMEGEEIVMWQEATRLEESSPYSKDKDIAFQNGKGIPIHIQKGMFYLVMPSDAHMPCCHMEKQSKYKKLVLKLPISSIK